MHMHNYIMLRSTCKFEKHSYSKTFYYIAANTPSILYIAFSNMVEGDPKLLHMTSLNQTLKICSKENRDWFHNQQ